MLSSVCNSQNWRTLKTDSCIESGNYIIYASVEIYNHTSDYVLLGFIRNADTKHIYGMSQIIVDASCKFNTWDDCNKINLVYYIKDYKKGETVTLSYKYTYKLKIQTTRIFKSVNE